MGVQEPASTEQNQFRYFPHSDPAVLRLRHKIRFAKQPDSPDLIELWFDLEEAAAETASIEVRRELYKAEFRLLLDTFCDDLVPAHWRQLCLDNINRPLSELKRISQIGTQKFELRKLLHELRVSSHFFNPA